MLKLSRRLQFIFDHLLPQQPVWDLCCDHGYIGLKAYHSAAFPEVNFVDQVPEIIQQLEKKFLVEDFDKELSQKAVFWAVDAAMLPKMTGTAVIAGVGAHAILKILSSLQERKGLEVSRLILGPQRDETILLNILASSEEFSGFYILNQHYKIKEGQRTRHILIYDKKESVIKIDRLTGW